MNCRKSYGHNIDLSFNYSFPVKILFILSVFLMLTNNSAKAQDGTVINNWHHFSDAQNSLYHHLAGQAYNFLDMRSDSVSELHSLSDWKQRQMEVQEILADIIGPFPEKTPLNATTTNTINKEGYKVEHIVYESQPEFYVTASLFIPDGVEDKAPAILYVSGHSDVAYRDRSSKNYQHVILNLVKKGFIVLAIDPVGQGERLEYYDPDTGESIVGRPTQEHSYSGTQAFITGSSEARYMTWDGIRAVDYLLSREEVDSARIGITGLSGGGTQTAYIAAMDDRIYASAPSNWITNITRLFQSIGPQDAEQNLFQGIARGIDHADLLEVRAPKPAMIMSTTNDFFSIQGVRETATEVSRIYKAYGKEHNFSKIEDDSIHAYTKTNREKMYAFFQRHLDNPGSPKDKEVNFLSDEELRVTRTGQVSTSLGGETVFSLNRREVERQVDELQKSRDDLASHLPAVLRSAKEISGYQEPREVADPVFTGRIPKQGYAIEKYFVKGEGTYPILYLLMVPDKPNGKALLYLHPDGKAAEVSQGGEMEWFARRGFMVLAPDLIGVGEVGSGGSFFMRIMKEWYASVLVDRSIVGIRAGDVARLARLLQRNSDPDEIYGVARGEMAPVLLHAAAFNPDIAQIALIKPLSSYSSLVLNRFYDEKFIHNTAAGALPAYDLPDLAASLAPRRLLIADARDGEDNSLDLDGINHEFAIIKQAYQYRNVPGQLNIIPFENSNDQLYDYLMKWIK